MTMSFASGEHQATDTAFGVPPIKRFLLSLLSRAGPQVHVKVPWWPRRGRPRRGRGQGRLAGLLGELAKLVEESLAEIVVKLDRRDLIYPHPPKHPPPPPTPPPPPPPHTPTHTHTHTHTHTPFCTALPSCLRTSAGLPGRLRPRRGSRQRACGRSTRSGDGVLASATSVQRRRLGVGGGGGGRGGGGHGGGCVRHS